MSDVTLSTVPVGPEDEDKRLFAWHVMKSSNDVVIAFAKLMSTTSMSAIPVVLSLAKFAEVGTGEDTWGFLVVGLSAITYLAATLLFSYVVRGRRINISPDDYDDVVEQFLRAASIRQRLTSVGLGMMAFATLCGVTAILVALSEQA